MTRARLAQQDASIAARGFICESRTTFYLRQLSSPRRARYRHRRYAAFSVQSASSSLSRRRVRIYSPSVKIPPSIIFHRTQTRTKVLRRLASIVCYSAVRMRRMTQYTASGMRLRQLLCPPTFFCSGASS